MRYTFMPQQARTLLGCAAALLALAGCVALPASQQAAHEAEQKSKAIGSVYTGWRVFQEKCQTCHGTTATGTAYAPNLLALISDMGPRRFEGLVLQRYDWSLPPEQADRRNRSLDTSAENIMQRPVVVMPAWENDPLVKAHIMDLYAYLSARAAGAQGTDNPAP